MALVVWAPSWLYVGFVLIVALWAQRELYAMFVAVGVAADRSAGLLLGALVVLAFAAGGPVRPWVLPLTLSLAVAGCLTIGIVRKLESGRSWAGVALTLLGILYCAWFLGHAVWLRELPGGQALTLMALGVTWCGETAAYFVGRSWGRHRLAPRVSPAKTVEGAVAQTGASLLAALVAGRVLALDLPHAAAIGLLLGVFGQFGDLAESFLKRSAEVKDAGSLLPGHGGLLDRLDSLLFNVPALYYYVSVFLLR